MEAFLPATVLRGMTAAMVCIEHTSSQQQQINNNNNNIIKSNNISTTTNMSSSSVDVTTATPTSAAFGGRKPLSTDEEHDAAASNSNKDQQDATDGGMLISFIAPAECDDNDDDHDSNTRHDSSNILLTSSSPAATILSCATTDTDAADRNALLSSRAASACLLSHSSRSGSPTEAIITDCAPLVRGTVAENTVSPPPTPRAATMLATQGGGGSNRLPTATLKLHNLHMPLGHGATAVAVRANLILSEVDPVVHNNNNNNNKHHARVDSSSSCCSSGDTSRDVAARCVIVSPAAPLQMVERMSTACWSTAVSSFLWSRHESKSRVLRTFGSFVAPMVLGGPAAARATPTPPTPTTSATMMWWLFSLWELAHEGTWQTFLNKRHGVTTDALARRKLIIDIFHQFASLVDGVAQLHEVGLVHRDVKPGNAFVVTRKMHNGYDSQLVDLNTVVVGDLDTVLLWKKTNNNNNNSSSSDGGGKTNSNNRTSPMSASLSSLRGAAGSSPLMLGATLSNSSSSAETMAVHWCHHHQDRTVSSSHTAVEWVQAALDEATAKKRSRIGNAGSGGNNVSSNTNEKSSSATTKDDREENNNHDDDSSSSVVAGTVWYAAPELLFDPLLKHCSCFQAASSVDIWSLGATLLKTVSGNHMFSSLSDAEGDAAVAAQIVYERSKAFGARIVKMQQKKQHSGVGGEEEGDGTSSSSSCCTFYDLGKDLTKHLFDADWEKNCGIASSSSDHCRDPFGFDALVTKLVRSVALPCLNVDPMKRPTAGQLQELVKAACRRLMETNINL